MRAKSLLFKLITGCAVMTTASCTEELPAPDMAAENYTRSFIDRYGLIDASQTWNQAKRGQVTLRLQEPADTIKVFGRSDGRLHLVAMCVGGAANVTLPFDVPSDVDDIVVKVGHRYYQTTVGGTVTVRDGGAGSRAMVGTSNAEGKIVSGKMSAWPVNDAANYLAFQANEMLPVVGSGTWSYTKNGHTYSSTEYGPSLVPEEKDNRGTTNGDDEVVEDFRFVSDGVPVVVYPMYWNTNQKHRLGAYYMDGETMVKLPLYEDRDFGDDCMLQSGATTMKVNYWPNQSDGHHYIANGDWNNSLDGSSDWAWLRTLLYNVYTDRATYTDKDASGHSAAALAAMRGQIESTLDATLDNSTSYIALAEGSAELYMAFSEGAIYRGLSNNYNYSNAAFDVESDTKMRSKGFYLQVEAGTEYGFYLELDINDGAGITNACKEMIRPGAPYNETKVTVYSERSRNQDGRSYAATFYNPVSKRIYFSFEDYAASYNQTFDLNDLVFTIGGITKSDVISDDIPDTWSAKEGSPYTWLVAAEDMGSIGDFDFNDVVVGITAVPTTYIDESGVNRQVVTEVTFKALAAGGVLPVYLHFDYVTTGGDHVAHELHNNITGDTYYSSITDSGVLYPDYYREHGGYSDERAEFHKWFSNGAFSTGDMINTGGRRGTGMTSTIYVNEAFEMENYGKVQNGNIDGFYITVSAIDKSDATLITPPGVGAAPQMFLISDAGPASLGGDQWYWPSETKSIETAYPDFQKWITNGAANNNWHTTENYNRNAIYIYDHLN